MVLGIIQEFGFPPLQQPPRMRLDYKLHWPNHNKHACTIWPAVTSLPHDQVQTYRVGRNFPPRVRSLRGSEKLARSRDKLVGMREAFPWKRSCSLIRGMLTRPGRLQMHEGGSPITIAVFLRAAHGKLVKRARSIWLDMYCASVCFICIEICVVPLFTFA